MAKNISIYYATNRAHRGSQWTPSGYGKGFSSDGMENLRFGKVTPGRWAAEELDLRPPR